MSRMPHLSRTRPGQGRLNRTRGRCVQREHGWVCPQRCSVAGPCGAALPHQTPTFGALRAAFHPLHGASPGGSCGGRFGPSAGAAAKGETPAETKPCRVESGEVP